MTEQNFKVLKARTIWPLGNPFVISSVGKGKSPREWWGEYFIMIDEPNEAIFAQKTNLKIEAFPSAISENEIQFMQNEIDRQIHDKISSHFYQQYEKNRQDYFLQKIDLKEVGKEEILYRWYRKGQNCQGLKDAFKNTSSTQLKEYLEVIMNLPPITKM